MLGDHESSTECGCAAAAPVPVTASVIGELDALVPNETLAVAAPLDCGLNVRVNDAVPPEAMVTGKGGPINPNSPLLIAAVLTVTLPPVALRVADKLLLEPTATLPKPKEVGLTLSVPADAPVPDSAMDGEDDASEVRVMLPLAAPDVVGVNVTLNVKLWPAVRVSGMLSPFIPNCELVEVALEIVTLDPPEFFKVAVCVPVLPTCTVPKLTALALRVPDVAPEPVSGIVNVEAGLLVVTARFTLLLTADWGVKTTLKEMLLPAATVTGKVRLVTLYPPPAAV